MIDGPTDLYRFYGAGDVLLYVGVSLSAVHRALEHRGAKSWWGEVARMEVEHLASRAAALEREREAIRSEGPRYNVVHAASARAPVTPPVAAERWPVEVGDVVALGLDNGRCPIGLVEGRRFGGGRLSGVELGLFSFVTGEFGHAERVVMWDRVVELVRANVLSVSGGVTDFDMDPLAAFQERWRRPSR